jgi:hypothetical protein
MNGDVIRTCICQTDPSDPNCQLVEFLTLKTEGLAREAWTSQFWRLFPEDEAGFAAYARSPGISIWIPFHFQPSVRIQSQYLGISSAKLQRVSRQQGPKGPPRFREALQKYLHDKQIWDREYEEA